MNKPPYSILFLTLLLIAWMGLTRSSHFGDVFNLPDASLAVFFLAGFYLRSAFAFPLFLTVAVASDYLAISHRLVRDAGLCVSDPHLRLPVAGREMVSAT